MVFGSVKALAETISVPVVGVSSLESLAYNVEHTGEICALIDARNNQVYCGIFDDKYSLLIDYLADDINNILPIINKYKNIAFVGDGALLHTDILDINDFAIDNSIHASKIGLCAYNKFKNGIKQTADSLVPMYLRKSQAERMKDING